MKAEQLAIAFELFDKARVATPEERERLIGDGSGLDSDVRDYVQTLMNYDSPTGEFLGQPVHLAAAQLAASIEPARVPEHIGPYRVIRLLGRGGFGTVFLAEEPRTRRAVAVKLMRPVFSTNEQRRMEFEAEALGRLTHPAIARVYTCGVADNVGGCLYITMEYIDGLPVDEFVRERRPPVADRIAILATLARAIAHAHRNGVLHRDLSPRNILVDPSGTPKVLDFGLASRTDRDDAASILLTAPGAVLGTLRYMSPEHLSGKSQIIDTRSDTFALGVIAFEVLAGRHPYACEAASVGVLIDQILHAPLARVGDGTAELKLPGDLRAVLAKSVDRDPQRRYQSSEALADDLENVLHRRPVSARPASPLYLARRFADRHRPTAIAALVVVIVSVSAAVYSGLALRRDLESRESALTALDAVVSRVLTPLAPKLGTLEERESLLNSIERDVDLMAERMPGDPRALRIRARFLSALADARHERARMDEAYTVQALATRAYEQLWNTTIADEDVGHEYSMSIVKLGDLEKANGRREDAFGLYQRALELDERLAKRDPTSVPLLSNLFWSLSRFEERALTDGIGEAASWRTRETEVAARMMDLEPRSWRSLEAAAFAESRLAIAESDPQKSLQHALVSVQHAKELRELDPEVRQRQGLLALDCLTATEYALRADCIEIAESMMVTAEGAAARLAADAHDPFVKRTYLLPLIAYRVNVARKRGDLTAEAQNLRQCIAEIDELASLEAKPNRDDQKTRGDWLLQLFGVSKRLGNVQESDTVRRSLEEHANRVGTIYPLDAECASWIQHWRYELAQQER